MEEFSILLAIILGVIQGIFEWLPISSEGNITLVLTSIGISPRRAVQYSLFLHVGTALSSTIFYRAELAELLKILRTPNTAKIKSSDILFFGIATLVSGFVGIWAYQTLIEAVTAIRGSFLIILIGGLLIVTGMFQRMSGSNTVQENPSHPILNSVLVGVGQGLAVLPGISRSGTTVGILLLRGYEGKTAFRLSFILSIPAALGAGVLVLIESGGSLGLSFVSGSVAILTSCIIGYLTIGGLVRVAQQTSFWAICIGLGTLAILGGAITIIL